MTQDSKRMKRSVNVEVEGEEPSSPTEAKLVNEATFGAGYDNSAIIKDKGERKFIKMYFDLETDVIKVYSIRDLLTHYIDAITLMHMVDSFDGKTSQKRERLTSVLIETVLHRYLDELEPCKKSVSYALYIRDTDVANVDKLREMFKPVLMNAPEKEEPLSFDLFANDLRCLFSLERCLYIKCNSEQESQ